MGRERGGDGKGEGKGREGGGDGKGEGGDESPPLHAPHLIHISGYAPDHSYNLDEGRSKTFWEATFVHPAL